MPGNSRKMTTQMVSLGPPVPNYRQLLWYTLKLGLAPVYLTLFLYQLGTLTYVCQKTYTRLFTAVVFNTSNRNSLQMSIIQQNNKEYRIFIQLNTANENELTKTAQNNVMHVAKYNDELKKPDTKGDILGDFIEIGIQHQSKQIYNIKNQDGSYPQ